MDADTTVTDKSGKSKAVPAADDKLRDSQVEFARINKIMQLAKDRQKLQFDKGRRAAPDYQVGDKVYVDTKILRVIAVGTPKFLSRWQGPYDVVKVIRGEVSGEVSAVKLQLPTAWKVHPVFHVSVVKPYPANTRAVPAPPPVMVEGYVEHEVEEILSHRFSGRSKKLQFLVKWVGYGPEENRWTDEVDLTSDGKYDNQAIVDYWDKLAEKARTRFEPSDPPVARPMTTKKRPHKVKLVRPKQTESGKRPATTDVSPPGGKRRKYPKRGLSAGASG
jgi:hypothetical protein